MLDLADSERYRQAIKKIPGVQRATDWRTVVENWWFDFYYQVDTSPQIPDQQKRGWPWDKTNFHYVAVRPKMARRVLRALPQSRRNQYTFVDLGSGKGRMLLMAARHGFKKLRGVELRQELHEQACRNFRQYNRNGCSMESLNLDAASYEFPDDKLVLFFFNPFSSTVMQKVLDNLCHSLERSFRDVWLALQDPSWAHLVDELPQLKLQAAGRGYRIYRSHLPSA